MISSDYGNMSFKIVGIFGGGGSATTRIVLELLLQCAVTSTANYTHLVCHNYATYWRQLQIMLNFSEIMWHTILVECPW